MHAAEVLKQFGDMVAVHGKADGHTDCHEDQADPEDRIDLTDDLVDGNECCDEIIGQDDRQPDGRGGQGAAHTFFRQELDQKACRADCKDCADHDQQDHGKDTHDVFHRRAEVGAGDLGNRGASVSLRQHTGEIVVHTACKDGAEGDPQKDDRAPQSALHGTEDRSQSGDVQQLDQEQLPLGHDDKVHAVIDGHSRSLPVIRGKGAFDYLAVGKIADDNK